MVAAVVTVAVTIVNGMVTIAQRRLRAEVELARIADEGQTNRSRTTAPAPGNGGGCDGGCRRR